jgi:hypothetical protein
MYSNRRGTPRFYDELNKGHCRLCVHPQSCLKMKQRIRALTQVCFLTYKFILQCYLFLICLQIITVQYSTVHDFK